jgi:TRADD-N domain-containing protein
MDHAQADSSLPMSPGPKSAVTEHLLVQARHCDDAWKKNIDRLAAADGNDVFKYVLAVSCIECHGYVTETQLQALQSFRWSIRAAIAGLSIVAVSLLAIMFLPPMLGENFKGEIKTVSLISGVMTTFISSVFFYLYRESLKRMEKFHDQLREVQKVVFGLFLRGISGETGNSDEERREILRFLMRYDDDKDSGPAKQLASNEAVA